MKRFTSYFLSLTISLTSLSGLTVRAEETSQSQQSDSLPVVAFNLPETSERIGASIVVTQVDEQTAIQNFRDKENVIFFTAGQRDSVTPQLDERKNDIISAENPEQMSAFQRMKAKAAEKYKALKQKVGNGIQSARQRVSDHVQERIQVSTQFMEQHGKKMALVIALIPGSGSGAYWYVVTSEYLSLWGAFGVDFSIAAFVGMLSKQFLHISKNTVGKNLAGLVTRVLKPMGFKLSLSAKQKWQRFGQVLTAYGMNLAGVYAIMNIVGVFHGLESLETLFLWALYSDHDTFDYLIEQKFGPKIAKLFSPLRIGLGSMAALFAYAGYHDVEVALGVANALAAFIHIFEHDIAHMTSKAKATMFAGVSDQKTVFKKIKRILRNVTVATIAKRTCEGELDISVPVDQVDRIRDDLRVRYPQLFSVW